MRYGIALLVLAMGCDVEPTRVVYNCTCNAACDGSTATVTETECGTSEEAQDGVDGAIASCQDELASSCEAYSCQCECTPTEDECAVDEE